MSWFGDNSWVRHGDRHHAPDETHRGQPSHQPSSSSDFGDYHSAMEDTLQGNDNSPTAAPKSTVAPSLNDNDLLMSFDDEVVPPARQSTPIHPGRQYGLDLLTEEPKGVPRSPDHRNTIPASRNTTDSSPSRQRHPLSAAPFSGPSSPPRISSAGSDIVFQAPHRPGKGDATAEFRRIRRMSDQYALSGQEPSARSRSSEETLERPRSIAETLAASKMASRWKRSVLQNQPGTGEAEGPTKTSQPIDISHSSPFAVKEQIAGAYIAPDGAPGFGPTTRAGHWDEENEWANTKLVGRRPTTSVVLTLAEAQAVCPRTSIFAHIFSCALIFLLANGYPTPGHCSVRFNQQVLSLANALVSLDQHGASLATLYRQVEQYSKDHRNTGNILVVRDVHGRTFGIYMNEPIMKREGTYYGSGEA